MFLRALIILTTLYYPFIINHKEIYFNFIIWNVGQGSWHTYINGDSCVHIDAGGEKAPWTKILNYCSYRKNYILLTHTDWDHINKIKSFARQTSEVCIFPPPLLKAKNSMNSWLSSQRKCKTNTPQNIKTLFQPQNYKNRNEASHIYLVKNKIVAPGDSTKKKERYWAQKLPKTPLYLILGHHGSNTSTSSYLLHQRPFKMAFTSSRKKRYGHPHPKVIKRLQRHSIPLLSTEIWGNIHLQL